MQIILITALYNIFCVHHLPGTHNWVGLVWLQLLSNYDLGRIPSRLWKKRGLGL